MTASAMVMTCVPSEARAGPATRPGSNEKAARQPRALAHEDRSKAPPRAAGQTTIGSARALLCTAAADPQRNAAQRRGGGDPGDNRDQRRGLRNRIVFFVHDK